MAFAWCRRAIFLSPERLSAKVTHRGITIDGSRLAQMYYDSLTLAPAVTANPFLPVAAERERQALAKADLTSKLERRRLSAMRLGWRYVQDVIDLINKIWDSKTGSVVLDEIRRAPLGDNVVIEPYLEDDPAEEPNASTTTVMEFGVPDSRAKPFGARINFTPADWKRDAGLGELLGPIGIDLGTDWGPGAFPEEVLLHELVHTLFIVTGKSLRRRVPFQKDRYKTESWNEKHPEWRGPYEMDEFMAIMITNIFHSECGRKHIRHSHTNHKAHDISDKKFLEFGMNKAHVRLLRRKQPVLFNALNDIEVPWNPLRHFRDAD